MPVYEFECKHCGKRFEARQTLQEHGRGRPACPSCGSDKEVLPLLSSFFARTTRKA
jgi:putative FmdB family regulatory protein